jgi:hypothetical protein
MELWPLFEVISSHVTDVGVFLLHQSHTHALAGLIARLVSAAQLTDGAVNIC